MKIMVAKTSSDRISKAISAEPAEGQEGESTTPWKPVSGRVLVKVKETLEFGMDGKSSGIYHLDK